jgi:hypothetical protein
VQALEVVARAIAENADCVHDDVDAFQKAASTLLRLLHARNPGEQSGGVARCTRPMRSTAHGARNK